MKKISTLALMAFFCCMSAMAQVVLGDIKFSVKDGAKLNPTTGKVTVTFPEVTGVEDPTAAKLFIAGNFGPENDFDAEGTLASGITIDFADDYGLEPSTDYTLTITSVKVDGTELAAEGGYKLNFKTRGTERKLSWAFQTDAKVEEMIAEALGTEGNDYWSIASKGRICSKVCFTDEEVTLDGSTVIPFLEDLLITNVNATGMLIGQTASSANNRLHLAQPKNKVVVPDCEVGDKIAIKFSYVDTKKEYSIQIPNATCEQAINEAKDSVQSQKNATTYVFEVHTPGDLTIIVNNSCLYSIDITPKSDEIFKYTVVAQDADQNVIKTLVPETEAKAGDMITATYPYWLTTADNKLVTYGSKGNPFTFTGTVKSDTTFVLTYKETGLTDVVYLKEGEDIDGTFVCGHANSAIRSSNTKAAYITEDKTITTLEPGSYKFRAILFDNSGKNSPKPVATFQVGETEVVLSSAEDNFTDAISDLVVLETATDVVWKAGGSDNYGLDVLCIYASTDAPDDLDGISEVKDVKKVVARKVAKDGRILIQTAAGTFNAVGVQVK